MWLQSDVLFCLGFFSIKHHGTHRVAFLFAPIVTAWLLSIAGIGIYNIIKWNPRIFQALSPIYMVKLLKETRREGWLSLGGVVLSITGVETMFADIGHFSTLSVKVRKQVFGCAFDSDYKVLRNHNKFLVLSKFCLYQKLIDKNDIKTTFGE